VTGAVSFLCFAGALVYFARKTPVELEPQLGPRE
jgi:hypothetical protein